MRTGVRMRVRVGVRVGERLQVSTERVRMRVTERGVTVRERVKVRVRGDEGGKMEVDSDRGQHKERGASCTHQL